MDSNKILNADILDIVFEGRNKAYGAYDLRKTYSKRLTVSMLIMGAICMLLVLYSAFANAKDNKRAEIPVLDVELTQIKPDEMKPEPPPVQPPKQELRVEIAQFTPPKIVPDELVTPEDEIKDVEDIEDVKIGVIDQEGVKTDVVAAPVETKGTGVVEAPKNNLDDYEVEFKTVQIEAKFPGGAGEWRKFLERNLNSQVPNDNGAPAGRYTVIVSFLVDKDGNISEVRAENDPGHGTAPEAVRAIKKGPKWIPAVQNGRNVIYRQRQSITFEVQEE
jgi:protein TonB